MVVKNKCFQFEENFSVFTDTFLQPTNKITMKTISEFSLEIIESYNIRINNNNVCKLIIVII